MVIDSAYSQEILNLKRSYAITVDEANIIHLDFLQALASEQENIQQSVLVTEDVENILSVNPQAVFVAIVDVRKIGLKQIESLPSESKQLYRKMSSHKQLLKIAVVAEEGDQSHVISLVQWLSKMMTKIKWFTDKREALFWLKKFN